jgi:hypothetical protein
MPGNIIDAIIIKVSIMSYNLQPVNGLPASQSMPISSDDALQLINGPPAKSLSVSMT